MPEVPENRNQRSRQGTQVQGATRNIDGRICFNRQLRFEDRMKLTACMLVLSLSALCGHAMAGSYEDVIAGWKSHDDVSRWLSNNFTFEKSRQEQIAKRLKQQGPTGLLVRNPATLYEENHRGYCADSANFAITSLNRIDPAYNARWVFIRNDAGPPNHWVAAFDFEDKLYIMDYGPGKKWKAMQGVHGPYGSLDEYRAYLASLDLPDLKVGRVVFREMPGQED